MLVHPLHVNYCRKYLGIIPALYRYAAADWVCTLLKETKLGSKQMGITERWK